jgi:uncharacterized protein
MRVFADTSALLKRYLREEGTGRVHEALQAATSLVVAEIMEVEARSALARRLRAGDLDPQDYTSIIDEITLDLEDMIIVPLDRNVIDQALLGVERHHLRALDALQLGSAVVSQAGVVLCADQALAAAARAEGVEVVDPTR